MVLFQTFFFYSLLFILCNTQFILGTCLREILHTPVDSIHEKNPETESCQKALSMFQEMVTIETYDEMLWDIDINKTRIIRKIAPMIDGIYDTEFEWIHKFAKLDIHNRIDLNDVIQLVSHRGLLKPGEVQYVHVIFRPKCNINVRAVLECEVLGGPPETIIVSGQSSDLMFRINEQKINFKIRSFHENAIEELIISNIAQLPFEYKTYLNEPKFKNELEGTILELLPPEKILDPEEETKMQIVMRPGVVGYFHRVFLLEIGHLPHIPIEVFGWGVIPQVFLTLYRQNTEKDVSAIVTIRIYSLYILQFMYARR